jgi:DNA (cytosine-5)-methyltransferase 1
MEKMCISTKGKENDVASTILAGYERTNMTGFNADNGVIEKVLGVTLFESDGFGGWKVNKEELSPTIRAEKVCAGALETVKIKQATSQGYIECEVGGVADLSFPDSKTRRGRVQENGQVSPTLMAGEQDICRIEINNNFYLSDKGKKFVCDPKRGMCTDINPDVCITLTAKGQANWTGSFVSSDIEKIEKSKTIGSTEPTKIHLKSGQTITSNDDLTQYRIRKLTPMECWRLMDFTDEDFEKAAQVNSNTQLYKQAGNSIVKNVLVAILGQMIEGREEVYKEI